MTDLLCTEPKAVCKSFSTFLLVAYTSACSIPMGEPYFNCLLKQVKKKYKRLQVTNNSFNQQQPTFGEVTQPSS